MICDGMRGCESRREQFLRGEILIVRVWNLYDKGYDKVFCGEMMGFWAWILGKMGIVF